VEEHTLDWPYAVKKIVGCAQMLADARAHARTSAAHVSHVLYAMQPVRALVGDGLKAATVETALLVESKASATNAALTKELERLLFGPAPAAEGRTTTAFLRAFATGHASAQRLVAYAQHAEAIAAILDHPDAEKLCTDMSSEWTKKSAPHIIVATARAQRQKHAQVTTRHVLLAEMVFTDRRLKKRGLPGLDGEISELTDLLDRTLARAALPIISAGLFGAIASVVADGTLETHLLLRCLDDDESVAFAVKAIQDSRDRLDAAPNAPEAPKD
jgi:hypothetical protein